MLRPYQVQANGINGLLANQKQSIADISKLFKDTQKVQRGIDINAKIANMDMDNLTDEDIAKLSNGQPLNEQTMKAIDRLSLKKQSNDELNRENERRTQDRKWSLEDTAQNQAVEAQGDYIKHKQKQEDNALEARIKAEGDYTQREFDAEQGRKEIASRERIAAANRLAYGNQPTEKSEEQEMTPEDISSYYVQLGELDKEMEVARTMPESTPEERVAKAQSFKNIEYAKNVYQMNIEGGMKRLGLTGKTPVVGSVNRLRTNQKENSRKPPNNQKFRNAKNFSGFELAYKNGMKVTETKNGLMYGHELLNQKHIDNFLKNRGIL